MTKFNGSDLASGSGYALNVLATTPSPAPGSASIVVDHNTVINPSAARIGLNANYWEDHESRRTSQIKTRRGLAMTRAQYARWPGGHKSDGVTFFLDQNGGTLTTPTPRLARFGSGEWPATDATYWTPVNDYTGSFARTVYGLQEFLDDCVAVGSTPIIVVAIDTIYNTPTGTGAHNITKAQAITNAVEMVRWCNITHSYGVKYWEIGNESWSAATGYARGYVDSGGVAHPETYGADFASMAAAMKAIDPTIKVGLNWNKQDGTDPTTHAPIYGYETAIAAAGSANVDFLVAHRYPFFNTDYAAYQATAGPNMVAEANRATNAIATLSTADQARIFVMMTETGFTSQPNNLGSGIIHAHILGAQLATANIVATLVWTSRYSPTGTSHDMLADGNTLTPSGMGMAMAQMLAPGAMVATTSSLTDLFAFGSYSAIDGRIAVLLVNRSNSAQSPTVATAGMSTAVLKLLSGSGPTDTAPTLTTSTVTVTGGVSTVALPANSVGVLIAAK